MSRMIPLKIADMAVAACNEEIAKHLLEIARLKGRVIALEAELESEKAAYKALRSLSFMTAVPSEDYEKLKADLEKSDGVVFKQAVENERLKAEVKRLTEAGDDLWAFAQNCVILGVYRKTAQEKIDIWNAAKEGKPQS